MAEEAYPYTRKHGKCRFDPAQGIPTITGFSTLSAGDESGLLSAAYKTVVTISIDAEKSFDFYKGGVYSSTSCGHTRKDLNHVMAIVGWGTDLKGGPYWIVRNSWGPRWGMAGHLWIARGQNMCGIAEATSFGTVK